MMPRHQPRFIALCTCCCSVFDKPKARGDLVWSVSVGITLPTGSGDGQHLLAAIRHFLMKICTLFFRRNVMVHLIDSL